MSRKVLRHPTVPLKAQNLGETNDSLSRPAVLDLSGENVQVYVRRVLQFQSIDVLSRY